MAGQYQREKIEVEAEAQEEPTLDAAEVAAEAQEEPTLDAADAQKEPALDLNQSEKNETTADTHMVRSRRSTLPYGDRNEHEMIEGRPVYESTKVSEALADASGGSGTEGGDSGERLHCKFGEVVADDMQSKPSSGFRASRRRFRAVQARFPMLRKMMHFTQFSPGSPPRSVQSYCRPEQRSASRKVPAPKFASLPISSRTRLSVN